MELTAPQNVFFHPCVFLPLPILISDVLNTFLIDSWISQICLVQQQTWERWSLFAHHVIFITDNIFYGHVTNYGMNTRHTDTQRFDSSFDATSEWIKQRYIIINLLALTHNQLKIVSNQFFWNESNVLVLKPRPLVTVLTVNVSSVTNVCVHSSEAFCSG